MLTLMNSSNAYLACGATDLRKSIDGLAAIIQMRFKLDPFSNCLFIFCNKNKDKIKILQWEYSGFWLYYKRLEKGRFKWPSNENEVKSVTQREVRWLLDGLSIEQPKAHKEVTERSVI
ncbi:IS66 family insertion sequence element accessory protein TnpB [Clostridium estertheticum]|uniref:IS66 family insertion sequence element accessory protein TnpB n=1 Tax=Clostridium estertheticum TaxID=238834 RepID=UPI0013EE98DA|nr:IS66 family insertion sequence element accessory protein TnpB [Clostridium estertheticum]MBZ9607331.1 IS66 family insertion sequence element accessory protein TnpB [Clostridium estertheticum]